MLEKELIKELRSKMMTALTALGYDYPVVQKNQSDQQGIEKTSQVFFQKLFDKRYGYARSRLTRQPGGGFLDIETQLMETTFQISALILQDPANTTSPTASDVMNDLAMWLGSRSNVNTWMKINLGLLRITEVRNPVWVDDRERFQFLPSFDITLTHNRGLPVNIPGTAIVNGKEIPLIQHSGTFPAN